MGFEESLGKAVIGQIFVYLGVEINLIDSCACVPEEKARKLAVSVALLLQCARAGIEDIGGRLRKVAAALSAAAACIPGSRRHMRRLNRLGAQLAARDDAVITEAAAAAGGAAAAAGAGFGAAVSAPSAPSGAGGGEEDGDGDEVVAGWATPELLADLRFFLDALTGGRKGARLVPIGADAAAETLLQLRADAARKSDDSGSVGLTVGRVHLWARLKPTALGIAAREITPFALLLSLGHEWFEGLFISQSSDSAVVAAALENGVCGDAELEPLLYYIEDTISAGGGDVGGAWLCREANPLNDGHSNQASIEGAVRVAASWDALAAERLAIKAGTVGRRREL